MMFLEGSMSNKHLKNYIINLRGYNLYNNYFSVKIIYIHRSMLHVQ